MPSVSRRGWAFSPVGFLRRVFAEAYEDKILFLGSAMTFDALLASVPLVLLLLSALGYFVHSGEEPMGDILALLDRILPASGGSEGEPLGPAEEIIREIMESRGQLSIYGVPLFLLLATRFFAGTRAALNEVFDTTENRSFVRGKLVDLYLVVITTVLVVANAFVTVRFANDPWIGRFVGTLSTYALGVALFFIIYAVAPTRSMRWDTTLVAAAVASLGFELAKRLYSLYLSQFTNIDNLISNANAIAVLLFVLWIYAIACNFLLGAEVAEAYDLARRQHEQREILG
jgi:membrane protein